MTLYDDLLLEPDCSFEDIKQQYRHLASIHHPDKGGDEEIFKKIKLAYEVLSDPIRRKQYDENKTIHVDNTQTEAINNLANIFFSIIAGFNCHNDNLIQAMKNEVNRLKTKAEADSLMNEVYVGNLEIIKKKLQHKDNTKENIILGFIEKQLAIRYNDREIFSYRIKLSDEMNKILNEYNYGLLEIVNNLNGADGGN